MKSLLRILVMGSLLGAAVGVQGKEAASQDTIVQRRLKELPQLVAPTKLTVGPDDNFQVDVDSNERLMTFTRRANLSTQLYFQNLNEVSEQKLLDDSADSRSAVISPDGKTLAFVYYKTNAQGDLCEMPVGSPGEVNCYKIGGAVESPSWWGRDRLLLVRRDNSEKAQLVVVNRQTRQQEVLEQGELWQPTVHASSGRVAFVKQDQEGVRLVLRAPTGTPQIVRLDLPGVSGFPEFSPDGEWLYFSHYFSDSNLDQKLDASDNSVIFRIKVSEVQGKQKLIPQQLTSSNENCSFPRVRREHLYMTCDFEGSLDVYRVPATGVVPADWDASRLANAHQTSRNYAQRILLVNHQYKLGVIKERNEYLRRMLSNFILRQDAVAGRYYLSQLLEGAAKDAQPRLRQLDIFLQALAEKRLQLTNQVTVEFRTKVQKWQAMVKSQPGATARLVSAFLFTLIDQPAPAIKTLGSVRATELREFDDYLLFAAIERLTGRGVTGERLASLYSPILVASRLSDEGKLFYAYQLLLTAQERLSAKERVALVNQLLTRVTSDKVLVPLLKSELVALQLIAEKKDAGKAQAYRELDKLMSETRANYFLRRTLSVRAFDNFLAHDEVQYLTYVATTWLKYTEKSDTEFAYARQIYVDKVLARAYFNWGEKKYRYASNNFYGSLSLTDDLESHYGYIRAMQMDGQSAEVNKVYESLRKREFVADNLGYVEVLLALSQGELTAKTADEALKSLHKIDSAYQSPMYQLLLGYLYLRQVELGREGLHFSPEMLAAAHKHLMLAYDLGRENHRIVASALSNLAALHSQVGNWGMARRFFELREPYGFVEPLEEVHHRWYLARAHFQLADGRAAAEQMAKLGKIAGADLQPAVEQQLGFYNLEGGDYVAAEKYLSQFVARPNLTAWNRVRAQLGLAYAQWKTWQNKKSKSASAERSKVLQTLTQVLAEADKLAPVPASGQQRIALEPLRLKILAGGLKAQLLTGADRAKALKEVAGHLESVGSKLTAVAMTTENWLVFRLKTELQLADLELSGGRKTAAQNYLDGAGSMIEELAQSVDYGFNSQLIDSLVTFWGLARLADYSGKSHKTVSKTTDKLLSKLAQLEDPSGMVGHHVKRLQAIRAATGR
ncbi:MAG: PD40 domain-containing protein [Bdellovibrionales bacterium]|nr:PD40 domain-containing protein [Bdellovibrionales bacterium]